MNWRFFKLCRVYSNSLKMSNAGRKFSWSWFLGDRSQVYKEKENFVVAGLRWCYTKGFATPIFSASLLCKVGATLGAFFGKNPDPSVSESKNGSWIHKIHTPGGFFASNWNPDFWDSQSERFSGKGFEKSIFDKRFSEQKWYTTGTVHVWHSNRTYIAGALTLSH